MYSRIMEYRTEMHCIIQILMIKLWFKHIFLLSNHYSMRYDLTSTTMNFMRATLSHEQLGHDNLKDWTLHKWLHNNALCWLDLTKIPWLQPDGIIDYGWTWLSYLTCVDRNGFDLTWPDWTWLDLTAHIYKSTGIDIWDYITASW